ncbi:DUF255 domain-containing protein [Haloferula chungangensis]|uniref:DUF255 domain-containing protein n=1 Tax=Haloferula chungangensis TaxID=1048331 RepID=A0ABW2L7N8_9BACT
MKFTSPIFAAAISISLICCKSKSTSEDQNRIPPEVVPEIQENRLGEEPSAFLASAADSKINWQPWSPEVLDFAKRSQRMVLVLIGTARYNGCFETLEALDRNPTMVERINRNFVPVLTDIDLTRETGLLAYNLSSEAKASVSFPFLILLSPEGNPVTWHPIQYKSDRETLAFFDNSIEVISRLWSDDPDYVTNDSALKADLRRDSLPDPDKEVPEMEERQRRYEAAMRRLESFYDEDLTSLAGSGGLFPLGVFDTLALARYDESLPPSQRQKFGETLDSFIQTLLSSAMVDPLDGGVHPARRGSTWNLVMGRRDCSTQARAARIFARMHQLDGYPGTLEAAVGAIRFAETYYQTPNGLFSLSEKPDSMETKSWLWTVDQVSSVLSDDEFKVWKTYSALNDIGNLPSEADPNRNYFRLNSLAAAVPPEEVAKVTGFDLAEVKSLIESGRKKLRKSRESRAPRPAPDHSPSALASFRMVSAYASLYTATGDASYLEKAVKLGEASRKHFLKNRFLNERPDGEPEGASDGRAFSYAIAIQAGLDLGAITLEDDWYLWAQDLTTLLAENFVTKEGRLLEVRQVSQVVEIDYEDRMMVFDDSTAGQLRLNLQRLLALGFQTPPSLSAWLNSLPPIDNFPIIFTDSLIATAHEWNHLTVKLGRESPQELVDAVRTLPLQLFVRRREGSDGVTITLQNDTEISANTAEDIKNLIQKP